MVCPWTVPSHYQNQCWNIGILETNFSEILIEIHSFSFKKMYLKTLSVKWRPFYIGLNVLTEHWGLIISLTPRNEFQWYLNKNIQGFCCCCCCCCCFNVFCKMSPILSRCQCVVVLLFICHQCHEFQWYLNKNIQGFCCCCCCCCCFNVFCKMSPILSRCQCVVVLLFICHQCPPPSLPPSLPPPPPPPPPPPRPWKNWTNMFIVHKSKTFMSYLHL